MDRRTVPRVRVRERIHDRRNVLAAFAERRQPQAPCGEPAVEIVVEKAGIDEACQVFRARSQDADARADGLTVAQTREPARPEKFEQDLLDAGAQFFDPRQVARSLAGELEKALSAFPFPARGDVAKKLPFQLALVEERTIDHQVGRLLPRGMLVEHPRDHVFPGARLAREDHGARLC
jgi:hypothetical protein